MVLTGGEGGIVLHQSVPRTCLTMEVNQRETEHLRVLMIDFSLEGEIAEGWRCHSLFRYFNEAPNRLFVKAEILQNNDLLQVHHIL